MTTEEIINYLESLANTPPFTMLDHFDKKVLLKAAELIKKGERDGRTENRS